MAKRVIDEWQSKDDAQTLKRAQEIQSDKQRHTAAQTHAQKELNALSKVVAKATPPKATPRSTGRKK